MARSYCLKYQRALGIYRLSPADGSHLVIFVLLFAVCRVYSVVGIYFEMCVGFLRTSFVLFVILGGWFASLGDAPSTYCGRRRSTRRWSTANPTYQTAPHKLQKPPDKSWTVPSVNCEQ